MTARRTHRLLAGLLLAPLALAACSGGDAGTDAAGGGEGATEGETLKLWHYEG